MLLLYKCVCIAKPECISVHSLRPTSLSVTTRVPSMWCCVCPLQGRRLFMVKGAVCCLGTAPVLSGQSGVYNPNTEFAVEFSLQMVRSWGILRKKKTHTYWIRNMHWRCLSLIHWPAWKNLLCCVATNLCSEDRRIVPISHTAMPHNTTKHSAGTMRPVHDNAS